MVYRTGNRKVAARAVCAVETTFVLAQGGAGKFNDISCLYGSQEGLGLLLEPERSFLGVQAVFQLICKT
jgi:hypothetical protein